MTSPAWNGLLLLLVAAAAAEGLVAVWAATSRAHWFLRALAVWGGVMLLVPVRVYEPALVFALAGPLTVGWLLIARRSRRRDATDDSSRMRYGVRDLMLLMVLVALVIVGLQLNPAVQQFNRQDWLACLVCGALLSATVALAALLILGRRQWATLVALAAVLAASAWAIPTVSADTRLASSFQLFYSPFESFGALLPGASAFDKGKPVAIRFAELALITTAFVGMTVVALRLPSPRWRWFARATLAIATLCISVPLAWLYWQMLWLTPLPPPFTGPTNHYPRVLTIADSLGKMGSTRPETQALYRSLIDEAVELADAPNYVVWDLERDATEEDISHRVYTVQSLRGLGRTLDAESGTAVMRGDYSRGSELARANVRLGVMLNRGGLLIESLVGIALDGMGQAKLTQIRAHLPPDEARAVLAELQRALNEVETAEVIAYRDLAICERIYGWQARLEWISMQLTGQSIPAAQAFEEALRRRNARNLLLQADLAARLFHHEQGRWPTSLEELVPDYLPAVPLDPYSNTEQPLQYHAKQDDFVLYSVGMDGTDNGGKFGNFQTYFGGGYDYDLDTHSRP